eukprot:COSAG02_NODE_2202_length_9534_cov_20.277160_6_plen_67_part_00
MAARWDAGRRRAGACMCFQPPIRCFVWGPVGPGWSLCGVEPQCRGQYGRHADKHPPFVVEVTEGLD